MMMKTITVNGKQINNMLEDIYHDRIDDKENAKSVRNDAE
jgi:hypothetical protein